MSPKEREWGTWTRMSGAMVTVVMALALSPAEAGSQEAPVAIRADRMLDVVEGRVVEDALVVVEGGRIVQVGGSAPDGARSVELGDATLFPGLIDAHTHLAYDIGGDWVTRPVTETAADAALRAARNARLTVEAGFTTVRDLGSGGFVDVAVMHAVENGMIVGPRVIPAGHSLSITGGHCDQTGWAPGILETTPREGVADGPWDVIEAVRYQVKHGAKVIKICATAGVLSFEGPVGAQQFTEEEMRAAVDEAARHGLRVAAHAHGTEGIMAAVRAGVASIEHGSVLTDEAIALMKERGTWLVPTTYLADAIDLDALPPPIRAKAEWVLPRAKESLRRAVEAGVKIAFGTDAAVFPHGLNAREFEALVERGMTPAAALRSATVDAAELLGVDDRGTIAQGMLADLVAVAGNPLEDVGTLRDPVFVMVDGKVVKGPAGAVDAQAGMER